MKKEEAIKIIRSIHQTDAEKEALQTLIPKLKESEDERIRKEIISALKFANDGGVYDKHIAYLEKQKEQKPNIEPECLRFIFDDMLALECAMGIVYKKDNEQKLYKALMSLHSRLSDALDNEQKEQKFTEWSEEDEKRLCNLMARCIALGKQKGWMNDDDEVACLDIISRKDRTLSEFDKKMFRIIISELEQVGKKVNVPELFKNEIYWLKCLSLNLKRNEDVAKLCSNEWSEEDEKMRQHIICDLREFRNCETDEELISDYEDEISWLKSLRPSWKPSEEQMDALETAVSSLQSSALESLYEQLKNL